MKLIQMNEQMLSMDKEEQHCFDKEISLDGRKFEFCGEIRKNFRVVKEEIANGKLPENVSYPYCCHFSKQS